MVAGLPHGSKVALGLFALTETPAWPASGMALALACLGVESEPALRRLLELGPGRRQGRRRPSSRSSTTSGPSASQLADRRRSCPPLGPERREDGPARGRAAPRGRRRSARSASPTAWSRSSGWPRSGSGSRKGRSARPSRGRSSSATASGSKTTRSSPGRSPTRIEPLPDMALLWIALARGVGLVVPEAGSDRLVAASPDFWGENAVHLPQMIATRWLALRDWHEQVGMRSEGSPVDLAIPFVRPSVLLWLAKMPEVGLAGARRPRRAPRPARARTGTARCSRTRSTARPERRRGDPGGDPARAGLSARAGPGGRGDAERPAGRPAHAAGPLRPGPRAAAAARGRRSTISCSSSRISRSSPIARG